MENREKKNSQAVTKYLIKNSKIKILKSPLLPDHSEAFSLFFDVYFT